MKLNFKKLGKGRPVIILHGLFGQLDNWMTFGKKISQQGYAVYLVDLRNHGQSPHSNEFNLEVLSQDITELIGNLSLSNTVLMGHSLGGKTAMHSALKQPGLLSRLIVIDIGIKYYPVHHSEIIAALRQVDLNKIKTRDEASRILVTQIPDAGTRQFLLKNLYWKTDSELAWRFNLYAIEKNIEAGKEILCPVTFEKPALFIRGEYSDYIMDEDIAGIKKCFPYSEILTAPGSGHWVHVDAPEWIFENVLTFLSN